MAPLTRNQQAALQANTHESLSPSAGPSSVSLSARLRGGSGQEQHYITSRSHDTHQSHEASSNTEAHEIESNDGMQNTSHDSQASLGQYGNLNSFTFASPGSAANVNNNTSRMTSHGSLSSALEQGGLLQSSNDWRSFGNSSSMTEDLYSDNNAGPTSHNTSSFYSMQEGSQQEQEADATQQTSFIDGFEMHHHREDLFNWKRSEADRRNGASAASMQTQFSTPTTTSKGMDHIRAFSNDQPPAFSNESLALAHRRLSLVQTTGSLAMDLQRLGSNTMNIHLHSSGSGEEALRNFQQQNRSMGQVGTEMNTNRHDTLLRLGGTPLTPVDASSMEQFQVKNRILSQSSSLRSPSPSDRSTSSTAFVSPHTSISMQHGGDSSVDTSIDTISNSVSSISAHPSRSSSTSDELMSIGTSASSRKSNKGKTRLRNLDRKLICEAARDNPKIRQEDLAAQFGIERSTVSKTLKNKDKWLAIQEESEGAMIIKHRNGKFPELEATLAKWAREEFQKGHLVLDVSIKHRALEIAKEAGLGVDSFKASVGWIEKFRDRHDIPRTVSKMTETEVAALSSSSSSSSVAANMMPNMQRKSGNRKTSLGDLEMPSSSSSGSSERMVEVAMMPSEEVDMIGFFSPRETTLRSQTSSSSMSNDECSSLTTHETPKASKRHYDDMNATQKANSSIDSSMASMHFIQRSNEGGLLTLEESPELSPELNPTIVESDLTDFSNASKRRKGGNQVLQESFNQNSSPTWPVIREQIRRTRSDSSQQQLSLNDVTTHQRQQSQMTASTMATPQATRRMEATRTADMQANTIMRLPLNDSPREAPLTRMNRTSSSPIERGLYRSINNQASRSEMVSPTGTSSPQSDEHMSSTSRTSPSFSLSSIGFQEDRRVTLEEARESLDLVLAFIARQPANLSPSDYFVLGNLQGTLSALASQTRPPQQSSSQQQLSQQQP